MRRRHKQADMNLDSLLDTMTNVVGILIVVVAVAQLSVGQAVKRIQGGVQENLKARDLLRDVQADRVGLVEDFQAYRNLFEQIEKDATITELLESVDLEALEAKAEQRERDIVTAEAEKEELDKLKAAEQTEIAMHLPEDRTVLDIPVPVLEDLPKEMTPITFACKNGRILPFEFGELAMAAVRAATRQKRGPVSIGTKEIQELRDYFGKHEIGDEYIRMESSHLSAGIAYMGTGLQLWFEAIPRRTDHGEVLADFQNPDSVFREALKSLDPKRKFVQIFVWSDSFDLYQQTWTWAREQVNGLRVLWIPMKPGETLQFNLAGGGGRARAM